MNNLAKQMRNKKYFNKEIKYYFAERVELNKLTIRQCRLGLFPFKGGANIIILFTNTSFIVSFFLFCFEKQPITKKLHKKTATIAAVLVS